MARDIKSSDAFEAALKREIQRAPSAHPADCPAPDVLAAYYDRSLSRNERADIDSHLLTCARCQSMMAAIARADDSPSASSQEARVPFWITRLVAPVAVVGVVIAIAIGMRTREHPAPEVIALASPGAEMKPQLAEPAPAPPPQPMTQALTPSASEPANAPAARVFEKHHHRNGAREKAAAISPKSEEPAHEEVAKAESRSELSEYSTGSLRANPSSAPPPARGAAVEAPSAPSTEAPVIGGAVASVPAAAPGPAPLAAAAPMAPSVMRNAGNAGAVARPAVTVAEAPYVNQISSPDGGALWRFGDGGFILRSGNSSPWVAMHSGVTTDLLAASAPSNDVCWIVGKSGTIVRTLDSGTHWQLINPPSRENFTVILASDTNNATVIAASGGRYITHDGGVTWSSP